MRRNCDVRDICNSTNDELFDPALPVFTCVRVACASDAECPLPQTCGLDGVCSVPPCSSDQQCGGELACVRGNCRAVSQADVARCSVLEKRIVAKSGEVISPRAIAFDHAGAMLPNLEFVWSSNDQEAAIVEPDGTVRAGSGGDGSLRASIHALSCAGAVPVSSFAAIDGDEIRVVVVGEDGDLVQGATVIVLDGDDRREAQTTGRGEARFAAGPISSVTVGAAGRSLLTIVEPGVSDLLVTIPSASSAAIGGVRGDVDISQFRPNDVRLGYVGFSLPENLFDFDPVSFVGEPTQVTVTAPELGLNNDTLTLPSGFMVSLGTKDLTERKSFCDPARSAASLDCYFLRSPSTFRSVWTLSGAVRLSQLTPIMNDIDLTRPISVLDFLAASSEGDWGHAVSAPSLIGEALITEELTPDSELRLLSIVRVPRIPRKWNSTVSFTAIAAADTFGTGFVPLGISPTRDENDDGLTDRVGYPFGDFSGSSPEGSVPLSFAPRFANEPFAVVLLASYPELAAWSMRIDRADAPRDIDRPVLSLPEVSIAPSGLLSFELDPRANLVRVDVQSDAGAWRVYAPAGVRLRLPPIATLHGIRAVAAAEVTGSFWSFGRSGVVEAVAARAP